MKFPTGRFQHFENQSFLQGDKYDHENMKAMMMGIIKHSQSTQSNKFAISLQNRKNKVRDGVYFLHADKHQGFSNLSLSLLTEVARRVSEVLTMESW